ncbi:MAG: hypothetical protein L6R42_005753 [Xanthoria sp. 1 TBL-2021]|nr:MAG: hypothetical protein L6R42_005753 [Xanthoria sp. 1 TBL-2021]
MLLYWLYIGFGFYGLLNGGGLPATVLPPSVFEHALKASYAAGLLSLATFAAAKLSVLLLYRRLFLVDRWFRTASTVMLVVTIMWFLASVLSYAFQCTPVDKAWQPLKDGHCFKLKTYLLAEEIPNCILDIVIVFLPLGVIRKLQLPTIQKINLCFIFALGGFVSFISVTRMRLTRNELSYEDLASSGEWLTIQIGFAVICCCLPTYRPLLPSSQKFTSKLIAAYSSLHSLVTRHPNRSMGTPVGNSSVTKLGAEGSRHNAYQGLGEESTVNTLCARAEDRSTEGLHPMHSINVTKSVDMV